jgi:phosphoserine phosphatase
MNQTLQLNQFYQYENNQLSLIDSAPRHTSKLSLMSSQNLDVQFNSLTNLLLDLSAVVSFVLRKAGEYYHCELYASHKVLSGLKQRLLDSSFDYLYWPEGIVTPPKLMLFDMDSTFIQVEVIDELAKYHQVGDKVIDITEAAMRGELDFSESLIARVKCLQGLSEKAIDEIAQSLPLSPGIKELVDLATANNCKIAIVSGGFTPFVEKVKKDMGLYSVKANDLAIDAGELTGQLVNRNQIIDAKAKADFLHELCEALSIKPEQVIAIGDGANDLLMMQAAGFSLAYRAKPKVEQEANGRIKASRLDCLASLFEW